MDSISVANPSQSAKNLHLHCRFHLVFQSQKQTKVPAIDFFFLTESLFPKNNKNETSATLKFFRYSTSEPLISVALFLFRRLPFNDVFDFLTCHQSNLDMLFWACKKCLGMGMYQVGHGRIKLGMWVGHVFLFWAWA